MSKFHIFFPSSPIQISDRVSDKYSRNLVGLDGNDLLLMRIIDAEEAHLMEWPVLRSKMVMSSSQLIIQEKNGLTRRLILKNMMMERCKNMDCLIFFTAN